MEEQANKRKCIYTGDFANAKDHVIPKQVMGDEIHNWAAAAPVSRNYLNNQKKDRLPTETELYLNELFYLRELASLRARYYDLKIAEVQKLLKSGNTEVKEETVLVPDRDKNYRDHKDKQLEAMEAEKEIKDIGGSLLEKVLEKRKKDIWDNG